MDERKGAFVNLDLKDKFDFNLPVSGNLSIDYIFFINKYIIIDRRRNDFLSLIIKKYVYRYC